MACGPIESRVNNRQTGQVEGLDHLGYLVFGARLTHFFWPATLSGSDTV